MIRTNRALNPALAVPVMAFVLMAASPASAQFYRQVNLVSDLPGTATLTDPLLVNPWGMAFSATGPIWVANAVSKTATVYAVDGTTGAINKAPLNVVVPNSPTGMVFNGSPAFIVSAGGATAPATFLIAGLTGAVVGWNPNVPPPPAGQTSLLTIPGATGAPAPVAYTGMASANRGPEPFLYAANNLAGRIDVFDKNFVQVGLSGTFQDPNLPAGSKPFNVVNIGGQLVVTYSGPVGAVNIFDTNGNLLRRFATGGGLLNPWGVVVAPSDFGKFSDALLIGNFNTGDPAFGKGAINAFDPVTGEFLGALKDTNGTTISVDGLWSLAAGNGQNGGKTNALYFTAGIVREMHGLLGSLEACHAPEIESVSTNPRSLWPVNHKMIPVTVNYVASSDCSPTPRCTLRVSSNEGDGGGSGNSSPYWRVIDARHVELRAERAGTGNGRVYRIRISCEDKLGLTSVANTQVVVPHDQGGGGENDDDDENSGGGNGKGKGKSQ